MLSAMVSAGGSATAGADARSALPVARALTSARHITASQTVLIIFCPKTGNSRAGSVSIWAVKGRNTAGGEACTQIAG